MARVKGAMMTRKRRNKILKMAKGYWGAKSKQYRAASEQVARSLRYAYEGRKLRETSNTQLPILLIDDLLDHLDTSRITSCFETLYSIDNVQVLLAGVQNSPIDECTVKV